jgi:hypothetical protein
VQGWAAFFFPPLGLLLVLLSFLDMGVERRPGARTWGLVVIVVSALVLPNVFMGVHFHRYLMWAFPSLLVMVALGTGTLTRLLARGDASLERRLFSGLAALVLVLAVLSTVRFAALYGELAGDMFRRDVAAARWITTNLPAGTAIANVATGVEYLTGHRNVNLHGVTSPAFFGNTTAEREAGMFESLVRLPATERPPYLLATVSTMDASEMLGHLVVTPPIFQSLSFTDELVLYRTKYEAIGDPQNVSADLADVAGREEVDRLNVCDSASERAHGYEVVSQLGDLRLWGGVKRGRYAGGREVMDAGRAIFGEESFLVRTRKGKDLVIVLRTTSTVPVNVRRPSGARRFTIDVPRALVEVGSGTAVAKGEFAPGPEWSEVALRLPGAALEEGRTKVRVRGRYASFQYWFFQ